MIASTVHKDPGARTMTIVAELPTGIERSWQLWADPRQLERWWGPPTHPATVVDHDLTPGARVSYFMTSPEGEKYHGGWVVLAVDEPRRIEVRDFFAGDDGEENPDLPTTVMVVSFDEAAAGHTTMTLESRFPSLEAMEQVLAMGADEGMLQAIGQIEQILTAD